MQQAHQASSYQKSNSEILSEVVRMRDEIINTLLTLTKVIKSMAKKSEKKNILRVGWGAESTDV